MRHGFSAFVGGSFGEIFLGNCTALGLPCVTLADADLSALMDDVEADPEQHLTIDLLNLVVRSRRGSYRASMPEGVHEQLVDGTWHATSVLLEAGDAIEACAGRLPYVQNFRS